MARDDARPHIEHAMGADDEVLIRHAWSAVATVRWSAERFESAVADAVEAVIHVTESSDAPGADPSLDRALTVMVGVLAGMRSARELLGWLEPPVPRVARDQLQ